LRRLFPGLLGLGTLAPDFLLCDVLRFQSITKCAYADRGVVEKDSQYDRNLDRLYAGGNADAD
jgi:hypothetical protein